MKKRECGMLTVESSIVLTLLLMAMLFLFSFARLYRAQNLMAHATLQTADAVALESFLRETALSSDVNDVVYLANSITNSTAISAEGLESLRSANLPKIAREKFVAAVAATEQEADIKLRSLGVRDGLDGVDFSQSYMDLGRDDVIIVAIYDLEMQFPVFGGGNLTVNKTAKTKTFGDILFEVSTSVNEPTWGTTKGDDKVVHGSTVTITATPNYGYKFVSWNDGNTDNPRTVTVTGASQYTAIFERDSFGINLSTKITYNTTYAGIRHTSYGSVAGAGNYLYMDNVTITATPSDSQKYEFVSWDDGVTDNPRVVTVTDTKHYVAIFRPVMKRVTVKSNNNVYGWAEVSQGSSKGASIQVEYGSNVQLWAITKDEVLYSFDKWSNQATGTSTSVTVEDNITYEAFFRANTYTVHFYADNREVHTTEVLRGSSVVGSSGVTGSSMPQNPTAYRQYFKKWSYNGQEFTGTTPVNGSIRVDARFGTPSITILGGASGGNSTTFTARTIPENMNVVWSSSNKDVISVDNGRVTAKYFGKETITASFVYNGETYSATKQVVASMSVTVEYYCRRDGFNSSNVSASTYGPSWWKNKNGKQIKNTSGMRFYYDYQPSDNAADSRWGNHNPGVWHGTHQVTWSQIKGATKVGVQQKLTKEMIIHDTATTGPHAGKVNPQVGYNAGTKDAFIFFDGTYDKLWYIKETHAPKGNGEYYDYYISSIE